MKIRWPFFFCGSVKKKKKKSQHQREISRTGGGRAINSTEGGKNPRALKSRKLKFRCRQKKRNPYWTQLLSCSKKPFSLDGRIEVISFACFLHFFSFAVRARKKKRDGKCKEKGLFLVVQPALFILLSA